MNCSYRLYLALLLAMSSNVKRIVIVESLTCSLHAYVLIDDRLHYVCYASSLVWSQKYHRFSITNQQMLLWGDETSKFSLFSILP